VARASTHHAFYWAGLGLAIDLANTVVIVRPGVNVDHLQSAAQLQHWLNLEKDLLGPAKEPEAPELMSVGELRDAIRSLLAAAAQGEPLPRAAVDVVNRHSAAAEWHRQLELSDPADPRLAYLSRVPRADQILGAIADAAVQLLGGSERLRVRVCSAPSCGMFFLEGRARQQWCSPSCGNRARAARHYRRLRAAARSRH
jgi:predicted RNA-binding Zn ribbon-like protein